MRRCKSAHDRIVYILFREDWIPFYVGKGQQRRPGEHIKEAKTDRNNYKLHIIRQLLKSIGHVPTIILAKNLTDSEACAMEILLIAAIGRKDKGLGPLVNLTDGGEGTVGYITSVSTRNRLRDTSTASWQDPAVRIERSNAIKEGLRLSYTDPQTREQHREACILANASPESRAQRSIKMRAIYAETDVCSRISDAVRASYADPDRKSRHSAKMADPLVRKKISNSVSITNNRPEVRAKISAAVNKSNKDPAVIARRSAGAKAAWARRKAAKQATQDGTNT